jgi:hypothetical protein
MDKVEAENKEKSRQEVESFKKDKPERVFAYLISGDTKLATWMGDEMGEVIAKGKLHETLNFGVRVKRQRIRVKGINGCYYSGLYHPDAGNYIRLKKVKDSTFKRSLK